MKRTVLMLAMLSIAGTTSSQDLQDALQNVGAEYGSQYVLPLTNSIGADLNAGLFHSAKSGKGIFGVNIYVGLKIAGMMVDPTQQRFSLEFPTEVTYDYHIDGSTYSLRVPAEFSVDEAPTIFGTRDAAVATARVLMDTSVVHQGNVVPLSIDTTFSQELIGGILQTRIAPLVIPHASFGSILGTDFSVRWLPKIGHPSYGHISLLGGGVRHNVSQYLKTLPVDVALSAAWQRLDTEASAGGEFAINIETIAYGIIVSKSVSLLTVYGGLQKEKTTVAYAYSLDAANVGIDESFEVAFTHNASSRGRAIVGLTLNLGPLITNFDYAIGNERIASAGIGFGF